MTGSHDVIVIGAGANGLAAAAALARGGLRVLVLERSDVIAGQAAALEFAPGFRAAPLVWDAGWIPPRTLSGLGVRAPERVVPEVPYSVAQGPGELLALARDGERVAAAIRRYSAADAAQWPTFTGRMRKLAAFLESLYELPPPDIETTSPREAWPLLGLARRFRGLGREAMTDMLRVMPMSVAQLAEEWFESATLRAAVTACGVLDIRHGPHAGGTGFVLLHHHTGAAGDALRSRGSWRAGPDAFVSAAAEAARDAGAAIRTGAHVARIEIRDDAVTGVVLDTGEEIGAARVVSSADPARTLLGMVDPVWLDPEVLRVVGNIRFHGCTAYVLYAAERLPDLGGSAGEAAAALRGVVSLTVDMNVLERAADAVKYGALPERPHIELAAPSLLWPHLAPAGSHVLVARVHYTSYRLRSGWNAADADGLAEVVTAAIDDVAPGFGSQVLHRAVLTPHDIERRYGLTEGAASHGELGLDQILFMRPMGGSARYAMPVRGLYLCGAGAHPGPGIAGGPGWLAARRVLADGLRAAGAAGKVGGRVQRVGTNPAARQVP